MQVWTGTGVARTIRTVHNECSNESSIGWIGKSTKLQCNVTKNFRSIIISSFAHGGLVQKWGSYRKKAKKVGFTFSAVRCVIKGKKSLGNDSCSGWPKKLNLIQSRSLISNSQKIPFKSAPSLTTEPALSMGDTIHPQTLRNVLYLAGIRSRCSQKNISSPK